jgi:predicted nucleic acid-binding protein
MVLKRVLDTNAILYFLGGKLARGLPSGQYFVSVISEIELLSYSFLDDSAQSQIEEFLSGLTIVGLSEPVKRQAIFLRRKYQLKLPDAIVAATATTLQARLMTHDSKLLNLPAVDAEKLELK